MSDSSNISLYKVEHVVLFSARPELVNLREVYQVYTAVFVTVVTSEVRVCGMSIEIAIFLIG